MARSNEPFLWALFSAGGVVAAFLMPVTIFLTSVAVAFQWVAPDRVFALVSNPVVRIYLFVIIALPLFHWAHRFRFTLVDLGLKSAKGLVAMVCYGLAIAGTILAAFFLWQIPGSP